MFYWCQPGNKEQEQTLPVQLLKILDTVQIPESNSYNCNCNHLQLQRYAI